MITTSLQWILHIIVLILTRDPDDWRFAWIHWLQMYVTPSHAPSSVAAGLTHTSGLFVRSPGAALLIYIYIYIIYIYIQLCAPRVSGHSVHRETEKHTESFSDFDRKSAHTTECFKTKSPRVNTFASFDIFYPLHHKPRFERRLAGRAFINPFPALRGAAHDSWVARPFQGIGAAGPKWPVQNN